MRLPLMDPHRLRPECRPLYEDMKKSIEANFKGFTAIADDGTLIGPWNPWLHFPQFGKPVWDLVKARGIRRTRRSRTHLSRWPLRHGAVTLNGFDVPVPEV